MTNKTAGKFNKRRFSNCKVTYQSNLQRNQNNYSSRTLVQQQSFQSHASGTEQSVTTVSEIDDECERLIATIKRTAAEYISGYAQLHSSAFKKEAKASHGLTTFFQ